MTLYAESSAVLRWLFGEPLGDEVLALLRGATKVVCSRLTLIECRRVAQRAVLQQGAIEAEVTDLLASLAQAAARWAILELYREIADRAEQRFPLEPVRTLDALHLASAMVLRASLPDLTFLSTDERVRANAAALGFPVVPTRRV